MLEGNELSSKHYLKRKSIVFLSTHHLRLWDFDQFHKFLFFAFDFTFSFSCLLAGSFKWVAYCSRILCRLVWSLSGTSTWCIQSWATIQVMCWLLISSFSIHFFSETEDYEYSSPFLLSKLMHPMINTFLTRIRDVTVIECAFWSVNSQTNTILKSLSGPWFFVT